MKVGVILPAAGSGSRMGGVSKPFLELAGKPLLLHCLDAFLAVPAVQQIVIALPRLTMAALPGWLRSERITTVTGGAHRADSVRNALHAISADTDIIVVHDAARPFVTAAMIQSVIDQATQGVSATVAVQVTDTLHRVGDDDAIIDTPDRAQYWRAQTPQAFPRHALEQTYTRVSDVSLATDEAGLVASAGFKVRVVPGSPSNIKITTPADLAWAEAAWLRREA